VGVGGPSEEDIPANATYAVATNMDRNAVNDGIFSKHLEKTHHVEKPTSSGNRIRGHTVIIRADKQLVLEKVKEVKGIYSLQPTGEGHTFFILWRCSLDRDEELASGRSLPEIILRSADDAQHQPRREGKRS
jgi:hypothetical protein